MRSGASLLKLLQVRKQIYGEVRFESKQPDSGAFTLTHYSKPVPKYSVLSPVHICWMNTFEKWYVDM